MITQILISCLILYTFLRLIRSVFPVFKYQKKMIITTIIYTLISIISIKYISFLDYNIFQQIAYQHIGIIISLGVILSILSGIIWYHHPKKTHDKEQEKETKNEDKAEKKTDSSSYQYLFYFINYLAIVIPLALFFPEYNMIFFFISIAWIEEGIKYISTHKNTTKYSIRPTDSIIIAMIAGLSFAFIENISGSFSLHEIIIRTPLYLIHTAFTMIWAYLYSTQANKSTGFIQGCLAAITLHLLYNLSTQYNNIRLSIAFLIIAYYMVTYMIQRAHSLYSIE